MTSLESKNSNEVAILMVPFPSQSHLNQLLQFSFLISSSYNLPVYYVASALHNRQAKSRVNGIISQHVSGIHFHDMPLPYFDSPSPDPYSSIKFPSQLIPSWYATLSLRKPFTEFLLNISKKYKRVVVIHDPLMAAVVQDVACTHNAESYAFDCVSSFFRATLTLAQSEKPLPDDYYPAIQSLEGCFSDCVMEFAAIHREHWGTRSGDIRNSCRLIEAPYLELIERNKEIKSWAIGPLVPTIFSLSSVEKSHECLQWLDDQEPNSVIYVSFGTTTSLTTEQIKELALGLKQSKVKFIWVLRDADKADVFDGNVRKVELPQGFKEQIIDMGIVITDWAPQPEILRHRSTAGFMSHCGWNSCMESISVGVPIVAWPIHSDQPANATFITKVLKVGINVNEWSRREDLVNAEMIQSAVRRLVLTQVLRERAMNLAAVIQQATQTGGVSCLEMDSFIAHITR